MPQINNKGLYPNDDSINENDSLLGSDYNDSNKTKNFRLGDIVTYITSLIGSGAVDSVNSQTGVVVLDADDIDDSATTNKFTTAADASKLAGIEASAKDDQTGAEIKALYEAEVNTNAFTDALLNKINSITEIFTTALKSAYDSASSWVTTNGTNVVNHLSNTSNPHTVTKAQVSLGNVDNTSDADKPVSTAQQTALNLKQDSITLTTTGTSGASTLVSGTLNIPQYPEGDSKDIQLLGDGASLTYNINHAKGTRSLVFSLFNITTGKYDEGDYTYVDDNNTLVTFNTAPTLNQYEITII